MGISGLEEIVSSEEIPAIPKKKWSRRNKIIVSSLSISLIIILVISVYIMATNHLSGGNPFPKINTNKSLNGTDTIWTVTSISNSPGILKIDVYVQVKNASGIYLISTEPLISVSDTHGFNYTPHPGWFSNASYISVGDVFSLNRIMYTNGSSIMLVTIYASGQFCEMTV